MFLLFIVGLYIPASYSQNPCPNVATVVYEGKTYNTVAIGDQCWLKENLDVGTQVNGSLEQTNNGTIEKYCYNNDPANCTTYGGLYQWNEAMQYVTTQENKGICPIGWHIPNGGEFPGGYGDGNALKAIGQGTGYGAGTNTSGFSALLAGYRDFGFGGLGASAFFWSSLVHDYGGGYGYAWFINLGNDPFIYSNEISIGSGIGFSVRCVNDLSVSSLLPVELNLFTAVANEKSIQLNWSTSTEKNSDKFNIERKTIDAAWASIGSVKASVLSNSPKQYSYTDKNLQSGKYQYRLKMIDNDGTFEYSKVIETEVAVPKEFELSQNFPNPFNPNTVISYSLPSASNVKLIVYNSLGQTVKVLENGFKNAGNYSVNFNANELPSGTYFYKIEAGQFSQIKKMMLLK